MSILVIIHSKAILIKTIQTTIIMFKFYQNQFCHNQLCTPHNQTHTISHKIITLSFNGFAKTLGRRFKLSKKILKCVYRCHIDLWIYRHCKYIHKCLLL